MKIDERAFKSMRKQVKNYTNDNRHTEALITIAQQIKNEDILKSLCDIRDKQDQIGSMTESMNEARMTLYRNLKKVWKKILSKDQQKKLHNAL